MTRRPVDLLATLLADAEALNGAACTGSGEPFVDIDEAKAHAVIRALCWRCVVVGRCRGVGDALAPHDWPSVFGARYFTKGEPVDGWDEAPS